MSKMVQSRRHDALNTMKAGFAGSSAKAATGDRLLSKDEARSYLGDISPRGVDRLLATRRLRGVRLGRRVLVALSELQRFISELPQR